MVGSHFFLGSWCQVARFGGSTDPVSDVWIEYTASEEGSVLANVTQILDGVETTDPGILLPPRRLADDQLTWKLVMYNAQRAYWFAHDAGEWMIVGGPDRRWLMFLSRTCCVDQAIKDQMVDQAVAVGFRRDELRRNLIWTPHTKCRKEVVVVEAEVAPIIRAHIVAIEPTKKKIYARVILDDVGGPGPVAEDHPQQIAALFRSAMNMDAVGDPKEDEMAPEWDDETSRITAEQLDSLLMKYYEDDAPTDSVGAAKESIQQHVKKLSYLNDDEQQKLLAQFGAISANTKFYANAVDRSKAYYNDAVKDRNSKRKVWNTARKKANRALWELWRAQMRSRSAKGAEADLLSDQTAIQKAKEKSLTQAKKVARATQPSSRV